MREDNESERSRLNSNLVSSSKANTIETNGSRLKLETVKTNGSEKIERGIDNVSRTLAAMSKIIVIRIILTDTSTFALSGRCWECHCYSTNSIIKNKQGFLLLQETHLS